MLKSKKYITELLSAAGITINGERSWDIKVHNDNFYERVLANGTLGLGESYMEKWRDCDSLDEFFFHVLNANLENVIKNNLPVMWTMLVTKVINLQRRSKSFTNAQKHYDIGNDLFSRMPDSRMVYTCAYWKNALTLDEAQKHKLDLVSLCLHHRPSFPYIPRYR